MSFFSDQDGNITYVAGFPNGDNYTEISEPKVGDTPIEKARLNKYDLGSEEVVPLPYYKLQTSAEDTYTPADGIPDIPADGTTSATITIQKYSGEDNKLTGSSHDETVHIKTDRGKLSTQSVSLSGGSATFELTSVKETIIANVEVYDPDGNVGSGSIQIQFAPENP